MSPGPSDQFVYVLTCPCGEQLRAPGEDEIVDAARAHLRELHPALAEEYTRNEILFMAYQVRA